jgi:EAL domain-containing protein (putative c-di-GMP-specific phosphodiesterase class I)
LKSLETNALESAPHHSGWDARYLTFPHDIMPVAEADYVTRGSPAILLELTETALLKDLTIARPLLMDLSFYGVGIHIDDFGAGYSSLSYLAELPVQTLKIDRCFVERLTESTNNARVVQSIIALGKAMELNVIAEGVETEQQLALVHTFGCDLAQGLFIGKPMQEQEFLDWAHAVDQTTNDLQVLSELTRLKA